MHIAKAMHNLMGANLERLNQRGYSARLITPDKLGPVARPNHDHFALIEVKHEASGLNVFIAAHSLISPGGSRAGEFWSAGGVRNRFDYPDTDCAIADVLKLSEAMGVKNAAAGLKVGGGKSLIYNDPSDPRRNAQLKAFACAIEDLQIVFTGQDCNISESDMDILADNAPTSIIGVPGKSLRGKPTTPPTAAGIFYSIQKVAELTGYPTLERFSISLQGLGGVGSILLSLLVNAGAKVIATDAKQSAIDRIERGLKSRIKIIPADQSHTIFDQHADVFSPNAYGGCLNTDTIKQLNRAGVVFVLGAANNQLADPINDSRLLQGLGIQYYGDFIVNAGGVIGATSSVLGHDTEQKVMDIARVNVPRLHQMITGEGLDGFAAAMRLAEEKSKKLLRITSRGVVLG